MKKYVFLAMMAMLVMTGCRSTKSVDALQGEWAVVTIGNWEVPDSVEAYLGFNVGEHFIYGNAGCNEIMGTLVDKMDKGAPLFGSLGGTRKLCRDMRAENMLMEALGKVYAFHADGASLYLLGADDEVLVTLERR